MGGWAMSQTTIEDRCRGGLIGLTAGDRIGGLIRMALLLAESLLNCGGFNPRLAERSRVARHLA